MVLTFTDQHQSLWQCLKSDVNVHNADNITTYTMEIKGGNSQLNPLFSRAPGRACLTSALISTVSQAFMLSFSVCYKGTVGTGQIHKAYCSITHWSLWGSIQLHWPHNWSPPLCCGKHFTQLASILINSLLLIMYLIDQFGPWVNWSIILIFFFCGIKWGANCSGLNGDSFAL